MVPVEKLQNQFQLWHLVQFQNDLFPFTEVFIKNSEKKIFVSGPLFLQWLKSQPLKTNPSLLFVKRYLVIQFQSYQLAFNEVIVWTHGKCLFQDSFWLFIPILTFFLLFRTMLNFIKINSLMFKLNLQEHQESNDESNTDSSIISLYDINFFCSHIKN